LFKAKQLSTIQLKIHIFFEGYKNVLAKFGPSRRQKVTTEPKEPLESSFFGNGTKIKQIIRLSLFELELSLHEF